MLNLAQKLYQLIINRLDGVKLSSGPYRERAIALVQKGVGGFIIFGGKKDEVKSFIDNLQSFSEIPLFIASDIERGVGQQIEGATRFSCQMGVSAAINKNKIDDVKILHNAIHAVAQEAIDIGINMPLIPVLDVNRNPDNPIICTRAFSDNPEEVAWYGNAYIKILEDAGLISCAKHFPGHGDTSVDSHIELPVISKSWNDLVDMDILPFAEAVKTGVSSIMIGHISIPAIDKLPATLSGKIITDLLRRELKYEGLVLTDALNMSALNKVKHVPAQCINAGADILLHPADADSTVEELEHAIDSGEVHETRVDDAVGRILRVKARIKNIKKQDVDYEINTELSTIISDKSITLVKDTPGVLPVNDVKGVYLAMFGDEEMHKSSPLKNFYPLLNLKLKTQDSKLDTVIFAIFTNIAAWRGSSGIKIEEIHSIEKLMKISRRPIVISFGSPYVLRHFMSAGVLIAAYDTTEQAQLSVTKCLKGELRLQGRLPVDINPVYHKF
jgi:beta-glucosidase-like glycosyl hydrolase